ncbi:glycoside hydrolase [Collimonas pratensis]|uniref:Glycosyl hydrolases related to GH101 family protein n=1 Tax=Collimonas pratensis TaxID=279113 RepID=A0A127PXQ6_9BURK|nr:glycoside hydrolase [Collimonas pratensis]AMP02598.1 glycosyl hydrolases related to GH101 family protein [Collimonas pratensis]
MKKNFFFSRFVSGAALMLAAISVQAAGSAPVTLSASFGEFIVDPATLAVSMRPAGAASIPLAAAAFPAAKVSDQSGHRWRIDTGSYHFSVVAGMDGDALRLSVRSDRPATLDWPRTADPAAIEAYAMPFGEGSYVPADDPAWLGWLLRRYEPAPIHEALSMSFWTELRADRSVTWIVETPFNTQFSVAQAGGRPLPALSHEFTTLAPDAPYTVRFAVGAKDPLAGARSYRSWLQASGNFLSLTDKIAALPAIAKLGGAPHIYLWGGGLLKAGDVRQWAAFVRLFQQHKADPAHLAGRLWQSFDAAAQASFDAAFKTAAGSSGYVEKWRQQELIRAINQGLQQALPATPVQPLPGKHDPAADVLWAQSARQALSTAFGPMLAPPAGWGGGLSGDTVAALKQAGLSRAWLGAADWQDALWHPQAVAAAEAAGYLVAVYDSYGSAHRADLANTWSTAQMGNELAAAGYRDKQQKEVTGFGERGVYVNARAVESYAQQRIKAVAQAGRLNSYFLDVDAVGPEYDDYTPGRETSQQQDAEARRRRLLYPAKALGLVTGSEGGLAFYAPQIAFAHGMLTQPFAWMDAAMKDKSTPYFRGGYWPPETPDMYFKAVPLKAEIARFVRSPQFRLPLYEIALHDSIVTTHHWEYGSLKFSNERDATALMQLLYMVPPLYHLNDAVLARDLPLIAAYDKVFRPLHQRLFTQAMTDFEVLSLDRELQRSTFADGTTVAVNFDRRPRSLSDGVRLPAQSAYVVAPGQAPQLIEMKALLDHR